MINILLLFSVVIFACVFLNKISAKLGIPMLLAFIFLGMLFGSDGLLRIPFTDYSFVENVCTIALIFIIFYGGFGTDWRQARPVVTKAALLSTLGVVLTAAFTGILLRFTLSIRWEVAFLVGAVVGSTDAASVFSVLRSRKLNLKDNTASLLELESGSNDPIAYMLTLICIQAIGGGGGLIQVLIMMTKQLGFGLAFGVLAAFVGIKIMQRVHFETDGFDMIFVFGISVLSYAAASAIGGNGYLSTYITGLIMGNSRIREKKNLVHFFDGATGLMQMVIFFLLGLLSTPSKLPEVAIPAVLIFLFLTFVARPLAVFLLMVPLGAKMGQMLLVSFAGLRGAASIVFAIMAVQGTMLDYGLFHIIFFVVLLSILLQGSLLPFFAKKVDMIDDNSDVMKTFTDYTEEVPVQFIQFNIPSSHKWVGKTLKDIELPPETLVITIENEEGMKVPNGQTLIREGDKLILGAVVPDCICGLKLSEIYVNKKSEFIGKHIYEVPTDEDTLIMLIKRGEEIIIPKGDILLMENDILVMNTLEA